MGCKYHVEVCVARMIVKSPRRLTRWGYSIPTVWSIPKCIGGVTNPMKNHSSVILPLLSESYLYFHPIVVPLLGSVWNSGASPADLPEITTWNGGQSHS